jgi:hypothetical protein
MYLFAEKLCVVVGLLHDVPDLAVGVEGADHRLGAAALRFDRKVALKTGKKIDLGLKYRESEVQGDQMGF